MYRLYYKCYHPKAGWSSRRTCFNSIQELITHLCKWNTPPSNLFGQYQFVPIDWEALYVSPLEEEVYPNTMEIKDVT